MQMRGDPHVAWSSLGWGSAYETDPAGLPAWWQQKETEERPFLSTLSIGVLSLWTKSEFGADKCCDQWPERNEKGWLGSIFQSVLCHRMRKPWICFQGGESSSPGMLFMYAVGFSPRPEMEGWQKWLSGKVKNIFVKTQNSMEILCLWQQGWSPNLLFLPQHPCTFPSPHPLLPQLPSLYSSSLSSFAWILSIADFSSAIKLNIPQRGGKQEF